MSFNNESCNEWSYIVWMEKKNEIGLQSSFCHWINCLIIPVCVWHFVCFYFLHILEEDIFDGNYSIYNSCISYIFCVFYLYVYDWKRDTEIYLSNTHQLKHNLIMKTQIRIIKLPNKAYKGWSRLLKNATLICMMQWMNFHLINLACMHHDLHY